MFQYRAQCRFFFLVSLFSFSISCVLPLFIAFFLGSVSLSPYVYNFLAYAGLGGMLTFWIAGKFGSETTSKPKNDLSASELLTSH